MHSGGIWGRGGAGEWGDAGCGRWGDGAVSGGGSAGCGGSVASINWHMPGVEGASDGGGVVGVECHQPHARWHEREFLRREWIDSNDYSVADNGGRRGELCRDGRDSGWRRPRGWACVWGGDFSGGNGF